MVEDARFEDASPDALRIQVQDADDLNILSALAQDAVFPSTEMTWQPAKRRFALLLNRFRWEDSTSARAERVQSLLLIEDVLKVASNGIARTDKDLVLSLLAITFEPGDDGVGTLHLTLAGDGAIAIEVECLDVSLKDVTKPYIAVSKHAPNHPLND